MFAHGTTVYAHGPSVVAPAEPAPEAEPEAPRRGLRKLFSAERTMKREFFGSATRPGISSVMVDAFNITQDRIARSRLAGDPPDVMISPKLGRVGLFEFHQAARAIQLGEEATERALGELSEAVAALV